MVSTLRLAKAKSVAPTCPYCGDTARLKHSSEIYGGLQDYGFLWVCENCDAWVGIHKNSRNFVPLGRLANAELREWKQKAHRAFDPLWKNSHWSRQEAYAWLTSQMGKVKPVHIGWCDISECRQVIEICARAEGK